MQTRVYLIWPGRVDFEYPVWYKNVPWIWAWLQELADLSSWLEHSLGFVGWLANLICLDLLYNLCPSNVSAASFAPTCRLFTHLSMNDIAFEPSDLLAEKIVRPEFVYFGPLTLRDIWHYVVRKSAAKVANELYVDIGLYYKSHE